MKNIFCNKTPIEIIIMIILAFIFLSIITYIAMLYSIGSNLLSHPELIGEWFSKLVSGFSND